MQRFRRQIARNHCTTGISCIVRSTQPQSQSPSDAPYQQKQEITGYSMMKGWQVAEFFIEAGVSGSVPLAARPQGHPLLEVFGKGDIIITAKLDRMFRSAADALVTLEELKGETVALHMIDLGGDVCGN